MRKMSEVEDLFIAAKEFGSKYGSHRGSDPEVRPTGARALDSWPAGACDDDQVCSARRGLSLYRDPFASCDNWTTIHETEFSARPRRLQIYTTGQPFLGLQSYRAQHRHTDTRD